MAQMQLERHVYVNMRNSSSENMIFDKYFNLTDGNSVNSFPTIIPAGGIVYENNAVSKGAVVYSGRNYEHVASAWLLAWDTPSSDANPPPRKVYVTCGLKSEIDKLTPADIVMHLAKASDISRHSDEVTKTTVYAGVIGAVPNDSANVSANFGLIPHN